MKTLRIPCGAFLVTVTALCLVLTPARAADETPPGGWTKVKGKRVLFFTKSSGYEHDVVKRPDPQTLSHSEKVVTELGQQNGFEVVCTKDGTVFTSQKLAGFDVIMFYTSGDLYQSGTDGTPPMTPSGKAALLEAIAHGKGFVAVHAASDSFHYKPANPAVSEALVAHGDQVDPYVFMLGAEFIRHGPQQVAKAIVVDRSFPGCEKLGEHFDLMEEWYTFKDFSPDLHVILALETKGMKGIDYQRAPFPFTWARSQGNGRVFYSALGHREDVWTNPLFHDLLLGGIGWAAKNVDALTSRNLNVATPGHAEIQPKEEAK